VSEQTTQQPEDARPAREELWRRLLAGQVTEVYVTGFEGRVTRYLPQTLGLEPIVSNAYWYGTDGAPRSEDDLGRIARRLSAEPRWIAGGGPWCWDRHFAARAEAVLIFELYDVVEHRLNDNDFGLRQALVRRRQATKARRAGRRPTEQDAWHAFLAYAGPAAADGKLTAMEHAAYEVRERYPDKTFIIVDPADKQRLRAVRASRIPGPADPA
jgi:hypothetical protein